MYTVLLVIHTILVIFLIGLVLIQRTSSDGMAGLGGGGGNQFLTGRATANLLTRATAILAGAFMLTSLILAVMASRMNEGSIIDSTKIEEPAQVEKTVEQPKAAVPNKAAPAQPAAPAVPKPE
jgi:preprotein translocase subunit SecG